MEVSDWRDLMCSKWISSDVEILYINYNNFLMKKFLLFEKYTLTNRWSLKLSFVINVLYYNFIEWSKNKNSL